MFNPGDRVTYDWTPSGGYGRSIPVAAIVRYETGDKVAIRVAKRINGEWVMRRRTVNYRSLRPRTSICPELGEQ